MKFSLLFELQMPKLWLAGAEPVGEYVNESFAALALTYCSKHTDTMETGARGAQWFMQRVVEILIGLRDSDS